ncbi:MAG: HEAT repeat domain-containing protein [Myxococcota bacterium]
MRTRPAPALRSTFLTLTLLFSPILHAQDDSQQPVCIKSIGDRLVAIPGDCPDELAPPKGAQRPLPPGATRAPRTSAPSPKSSTPSEEATPLTPSAPRSDIQRMQIRLKAMAMSGDERESLQTFEALISEGAQNIEPLAALYLNRREDTRIRWIAGRALGRLYSRRSVEVLQAGFRDPVAMVRLAAIKGAQDMGDRVFLSDLVTALDDKAAVVRAGALDALAGLGTQAEVSAVIAQLQAPQNFNRGKGIFVRPHAVTTLGRLGGPEATQALIEALEDRDPETQEAARKALLQLSGRSGSPSGNGSERERWQRWWNGQSR